MLENFPNYQPVDIIKHPEIQELLKTNGIVVRKSATTIARKPLLEEVGTQITTYVKKSLEDFSAMQTEGYSDESYKVVDGVIIVKSRCEIQHDSVISRNPQPLGEIAGKSFYNEWTQGNDTWLKNYGKEPGTEFASYKKSATNRVLKIDNKIMDLLCGDADALTTTIAVSWNPNGQEVYKDGYIVDAGYGLEQGEFDKTYELINENSTLKAKEEVQAKIKATL
jgi:hypothetical protein